MTLAIARLIVHNTMDFTPSKVREASMLVLANPDAKPDDIDAANKALLIGTRYR